jgi:hypothetical protein
MDSLAVAAFIAGVLLQGGVEYEIEFLEGKVGFRVGKPGEAQAVLTTGREAVFWVLRQGEIPPERVETDCRG